MSRRPNPLDPYTSWEAFLGAELRRAREHAGLSQDVLGRQLYSSGSTVGRHETGETPIPLGIAERYDEILKTGGSLARLRRMIDQQPEPTDQQDALQVAEKLELTENLPVGQSHLRSDYAEMTTNMPINGMGVDFLGFAVVFTLDGGCRIVPLDRRALIAGGAASAISMSATSGRTVTSADLERMDPELLLEHFRTLRKSLGIAGDLFGCGRVVKSVVEQLALLSSLYENARGRLRTELLTVGACYAEFAGILHSDVGNSQAAIYWIDRAMEWAFEAGDRNTVAYVLRRKSYQAAGERDAARAIGLAQAAQREEQLSARVRALACLEEARGHAFDRNEIACQRKLDEADELMTDGVRHDDIESDLGYFCTAAYVDFYRATSWAELGQPSCAIELCEQALMALPASQYWDRGEFLSWQTHAHVANNDPEQAATVGQEALMISRYTGSSRARNELNRLSAKLARWAELPAVRDFTQALVEA